MIESKLNKTIKEWKKLHKKKYRDEQGKFLVEGWHLIEEVTKSDWQVDKLIIHEYEKLPEKWKHYDYVEVSAEVFNELSSTETPQGIMAVVNQKHEQFGQSLNKVLLIDAVQDPGNVGTIIRSALAFNLDAVVLGKGTVDLYHEKVIRATQGALFHLPVLRGDLDNWMGKLNELDIPILGTALDEKARPLNEIATKRFAVLVGNEGKGVSSDLLKQVDDTIYIPIHKDSESLNVGVATSIVLYHLTHLT